MKTQSHAEVRCCRHNGPRWNAFIAEWRVPIFSVHTVSFYHLRLTHTVTSNLHMINRQNHYLFLSRPRLSPLQCCLAYRETRIHTSKGSTRSSSYMHLARGRCHLCVGAWIYSWLECWGGKLGWWEMRRGKRGITWTTWRSICHAKTATVESS